MISILFGPLEMRTVKYNNNINQDVAGAPGQAEEIPAIVFKEMIMQDFKDELELHYVGMN